MSEIPNPVPARTVKPGGTIRFTVGSLTGLRSSSWRIWSAKKTTDVYVAARSIAGVQKVSLHQSGSWSYSFVSDDRAAQFVAPGASRHVDIWQQPPQFGDGWRRGYSIIVPWTELRPWSYAEPGDIAFAPPPGRGYWVYIEIVFVAACTPTRLVLDEMYALGSMELVDGGEVKVIARRVRPSRGEVAKLAAAREAAVGRVATTLAARPLRNQDGNLRIGIHGDQNDGTRCWIDLAGTPAPPGHAVICTGRPIKMPTVAER